MQHVPVKDRLTNCCLANSRMHAAAVAATDELIIHGLPTANVDSYLTWLDKYGQQMTCLGFQSFPKPLLQLPCLNLLELTLNGGYLPDRLQLGPVAVNEYPGVLQGCTKLTCLEVCNHLISDVVDGPLQAQCWIVFQAL